MSRLSNIDFRILAVVQERMEFVSDFETARSVELV